MSAAKRARSAWDRLLPLHRRLLALAGVVGALVTLSAGAGTLRGCTASAASAAGLETIAGAEARCTVLEVRIDSHGARLGSVETAQIRVGDDVRWLVRSLDRLERYAGTARPADPPPAGVADGGAP